MTRIILIAVAAVLAYFAVGLLVLKLLWIFGQVDRLSICEEEQVMIVMVWPLYLVIFLPVYSMRANMRKRNQSGRNVKK